MGKTLFLYIFKDLLKVFFLASFAMAGIMSFAGLLRPLTQHGLDLSQVGEMLAYFLPAMTNYSWPVAALFATTFVYGRLSADNEVTACRAAGVSYFMLMLPALLLGTIVAAASLALMLYIVPEAFLRAERVVYSNLAKLVANEIDRKQRIQFNSQQGDMTVFARSAEVLDSSPQRPTDQAVNLKSVVIVTYLNQRGENNALIPEDFYIARNATAVISMPTGADGEVLLRAVLEGGAKIPRQMLDSKRPVVQAQIDSQGAGPFPLSSPLRETARFMNIYKLLDLRENAEKGRRVARHLVNLLRTDQQTTYLNQLLTQLKLDRNKDGRPDSQMRFEGLGDDYTLTFLSGDDRPPQIRSGKLIINSGDAENPGLQFTQTRGIDPIDAQAREIVIESFPDNQEQLLTVTFDLIDSVIWRDGQPSARRSVQRQMIVQMPQDLVALTQIKPSDYLRAPWVTPAMRKRLQSDLIRQQNQVEGELHVRFSYASSCVVLVVIGTVIGMMFRSGNFVSAFAISAVPAMLSIVLIVVGQQMCENVPRNIPTNFQNPLQLGISMIWGGNVAVASLAVVLFMKLRKS